MASTAIAAAACQSRDLQGSTRNCAKLGMQLAAAWAAFGSWLKVWLAQLFHMARSIIVWVVAEAAVGLSRSPLTRKNRWHCKTR